MVGAEHPPYLARRVPVAPTISLEPLAPTAILSRMPEYRRVRVPGGTYFFTVVTYDRRPILCQDACRLALRAAIQETRVRFPFESPAWVLLPDHLHCIWKLPEGDADFPTRWRLIKARFSRLVADGLSQSAPANPSRQRHAERTVWQRRYWEHAIRNEEDLRRHIDYIHFNPVKHGLAAEPGEWLYSTY